MPASAVRSPLVCALCGGAVRDPRPTAPRLCGALVCAHRHAALPPHAKCRICTTPLDPVQWADGVCASTRCRMEWLGNRPHRIVREARARDLLARRSRAAAQRGIPREERESWRLSVVPRNSDRASTLPAKRRRTFEAHLRTNLAAARRRLAAGTAVPPARPAEQGVDRGTDRSAAEQEAEQALLAAGCATCRGHCCRGGGNHAFNDDDTMVGYLQRFPEHDDDTIVARYLSHLQRRTLTHGCVYQVSDGCSLPRDLRADICNRYYCPGLKMIRGQYGPGDPVRAYFVHHAEGALSGGRFVQIEVRRR